MNNMITKWSDLIIAVCAAALVAYGLLQTQEVRIARTETDINKIDAKLDQHLIAHEQQNQEIMAMMSKIQMDIQVIITKLQMREKI